METNKKFLPKFDISNNLSGDMKKIEISKALSAGWYKGKFHYHMEKAGCIKRLNGIDYYSEIRINEDSYNFLNKGTRGYDIAEVLRIFGFDDTDLNQLLQTWRNDGVNGLLVRWKYKNEINPETFSRQVQRLKDEISGVDTIEIDYEFQKYKTSVYTTEASRIYRTKEELYGNRLQWGTKQANYINSIWNVDNRVFSLDNSVLTRGVEILYGNTIRMKSGGVDVTNNYSVAIQNAIRSMIAYSGNDFMQRTSYSKIGEVDYTVEKYGSHMIPLVEYYKSAIGTEIFDATIKSSFILDENNEHFIRYTGIYPKIQQGKGASRIVNPQEERTTLTGRKELTGGNNITSGDLKFYTNAFWQYSIHNETIGQLTSIVKHGDEFLLKKINDKTAYINVREFKKLNMKDVGYYLGNYFDLYVKTKDSGGGFFGGFIGAVAGLLGTIFDLAFDIIQVVPALKLSLQVMTIIVNKIFGTEMTDKDIWQIGSQIAVVVASILLAPETGGTSFGLTAGEFSAVSAGASLALSLAVAGSKGNDAKDKAEKEQRAKEQEQKNREAEKKLQSDEEEKKKKIDSEDKQNAEEDFQAFLKNPMYKFDRERTKMKGDLKSQFKLI